MKTADSAREKCECIGVVTQQLNCAQPVHFADTISIPHASAN